MKTLLQKLEIKGKTFAIDIGCDILGCLIFSIGIQCFSAPNNIAPGGVTGISIIFNYLFGISLSLFTLIVNIPLLILAFRFLGVAFAFRTVKTVLILSGMLELAAHFSFYHGEMMLAGLYGGVLEGIGLSLILIRGSTTGGTDVASRLLQITFPNMSMGRLIMVLDGCVLVASALVYQNIENALYGLIAIFACTRIIDSIVYGLDTGKTMMIITEKHQEIARRINLEIDRGCTLLQAKGTYTQEDRPVLMCVVRKSQFFALKRLVYEEDSRAFVVAMEASEIVGEGFKDPQTKR